MRKIKHKILIIDNEPSILEWLQIALEEHFEVRTLQNPLKIAKVLEEFPCECVVSDIRMPGKDGFSVLEDIKKFNPNLPLIFITAYGTIESAIESFRKGARDYLLKPFTPEELIFRIEKALGEDKIREFDSIDKFFIGTHPLTEEVKKLVRISASYQDTTVLITGESGVGKEIVAKLIHNLSKRKEFPFRAINCASIPENLLESELFGFKKGAFTGAVSDKKGILSAANMGTVFLDEIGDMPLSLQAKLLRVIEENKITPLGTVQEEKIDVRIIAATHRDIKLLVREGKFREDLYYRLNIFPINIPPLRERKEDIPLLVEHFLKRFSQKFSRKISIDKDAVDVLFMYSWPGNVRELENLIERLSIISETGNITKEDIPLEIRTETELSDWKRIEWNFIKQVIEETGSIKEASKRMGVHQSTIYRKIKKYKDKYE